MRERLRTTNWRSWSIGVGIVAVVTGAMTGVDHGSVAQGVKAALFAGIGAGIISLAFGQDRRYEHLSELSDADRATVVRTVREGAVVRDARVAPAVIDHVELVRGECNRKEANQRFERLLYGFFALVGICFAVAKWMDGNTAAALSWILPTGLVVAPVVLGPRRRERTLQRLERVENSARAFLDSPW